MVGYFKVCILILRRKRALIVFPVTMLLVLSILSVYALSSIRTLYYVDKALLGLNDGLVVSSVAISPFTSLVNSEELNRLLAGVEGVEIEYFFITLAYVYDKLVVVHGLEAGVETGCAYLGKDLATLLHVSAGEIIPVYSPFRDSTYFFEICGLLERPILLVNYEDAVKIRGVKPGYYALAVIKAKNPEALREVYRVLGLEPAEQKILSRALLVLVRRGGKISVEVYEDIVEGYLYRLGIYRDFVFYFAYAVTIISTLSTPVIGVGLVIQLRREIYALRLLGASRGEVFLALSAIIAIAALSSYLLAQVVAVLGFLPGVCILGHYVSSLISIRDLVCVHSVHSLLCIVGMYTGLTRYVE